MSITIGPARIADVDGTHEPGATLDNPSQALLDLAEAKTSDPATGLPYAFDPARAPRAAKTATSATPDVAPATNDVAAPPEPEPDPEPVASATSAEEAA